MKECWVTEPLHFEMRETEIPEPKDNEVQIKMMAAGVCGSDIHIYKGENPNSRYPLIPGHENVGLVTKVGADCKNIKVGDHVVIDYVIRCGECYQCKHGRGNVCEHVLVRGSGTNGGWREYWCVEEPYVYKIDDSIPWKDAALIEPLTIGEHSTSRAGVCEDDVVFILGTGTIGTIIAQACKLKGAKTVICCDISDSSLERSKQFGADYTVNSKTQDIVAEVQKITNGHGRGAELLMDAEAAYLQGAWEKAAVLLERARADAAGQENMTLCCDFLALRLALCGKGKEGYDFAAKRAALLQKHDGVQVHLLESIAAYFYALQGRPEQAPELFREHKLAEVSFFGPCRPMMSLIEQQIWLAQGEYVKVIAHSEGLLRRCEAMHYGLVGLQTRIQLAAAQLRFGQRADARAALAAALLDAVQDDFWVLFVEQYPALAPLLEGEDWAANEPRLGPFVARILPAGRAFAARLGLRAPAPELPLTDRDRELARLVAGRCTNKEIAAALYLSEGTVKQYINQLYAKLDMGGDPRTRRARLAEWYQKNAPRN